MATPRLDDANIEFTFTPSESIAARILDAGKVAWIQTKYAQYWKVRNSIPVSEEAETDRSYFTKVAELDGRLSALQEILDDHKAAMSEMNATRLDTVAGTNSESPDEIAKRAAAHVHRIPTA